MNYIQRNFFALGNILVIALMSTLAYSQQDKVIVSRGQDKDTVFSVNQGGTITERLRLKGTSGIVIKGVTDGSGAGVGEVGEVIRTSTMSNLTAITSYTPIVGASLSLTAGSWEIKYHIEAAPFTGASSTHRTACSISIFEDGVLIPETVSRAAVESSGAISTDLNVTLTGSTIVNISNSKVYTARAKYTDIIGSGGCTAIAGTNPTSFYAIRIR